MLKAIVSEFAAILKAPTRLLQYRVNPPVYRGWKLARNASAM
jgi:hypothetical protein